MSSTDYPNAAAAASAGNGRNDQTAPRRLSDGVLQSAGDAAVRDGLPDTTPQTGEFSVGEGGQDEGPASDPARRASAALSGVKDFVAQRPCTAALLAAGAGALTMIFLGRQARRSRMALPWQNQRQRIAR